MDYVVPDDQASATGIFVSGGWHAFTQRPDGTLVLSMPADQDHAHLGHLGFVPVPTPTPDA